MRRSVARSSVKYRSPKASRAARLTSVPKVIGFGLFLAAAIVGVVAATAPTQLQQAVVFKSNLPSGSKISAADLEQISLPLIDELARYELSVTELVGSELNQNVSVGQLAALTDISLSKSSLQELTLSFDQKLLPAKVGKGDVFDLWIVPQDLAGSTLGSAKLIKAELPVAGLAEGSSALAAEIPITFFIAPAEVAKVLDAISTGKPYLVRR
jgi:hypothetical protein